MATYGELSAWNPKLLLDGVCRGSIPYSEINALQTGSAVTNTFVEGFLGGPHPPNVAAFDPNAGSIPIGPGTTYPKPWRSASQKLQDASYGSTIGPFARIVKVSDLNSLGNTCVDSCMTEEQKLCGGESGGIWGRIGLGDGSHPGFRAQPWFIQSEGTYNTAYWNDQGADWLTWKQWWSSASKATIPCVWVDQGNIIVEVEVAYSLSDIGDVTYWPGPNLGAVGDASYDLIIAMVAIAAIGRWIF